MAHAVHPTAKATPNDMIAMPDGPIADRILAKPEMTRTFDASSAERRLGVVAVSAAAISGSAFAGVSFMDMQFLADCSEDFEERREAELSLRRMRRRTPREMILQRINSDYRPAYRKQAFRQL